MRDACPNVIKEICTAPPSDEAAAYALVANQVPRRAAFALSRIAPRGRRSLDVADNEIKSVNAKC